MANKRNDAMYRAKTAYLDQLRYGRVLTKGGMLVASEKGWTWLDNNVYEVTIEDGKIARVVKGEEWND